jgi:hypothetical protein
LKTKLCDPFESVAVKAIATDAPTIGVGVIINIPMSPNVLAPSAFKTVVATTELVIVVGICEVLSLLIGLVYKLPPKSHCKPMLCPLARVGFYVTKLDQTNVFTGAV